MRIYAIELYAVLTTLVTTILALQTPHGGVGLECSLSSTQASSIRATMAPWRNASCAYNMSLETVLGMV